MTTRYKPTGPFGVGARDLFYGATAKAPAPLIPEQHLAARVFYPCQLAASWLLPQPTFWLAHANYARGYATYMFNHMKDKGVKYWLMQRAVQGAIYALGSSATLPVSWNAPLQPAQAPAPHPAGPEAPAAQQQQPLPAPGQLVQQQWPVIIYSHGLAGNRNTYSSICIEMASQGYVVVALEHADGTASAAHLAHVPSNTLPGVDGKWRYYPGWGGANAQFERTRWREQEVLTAHRLLTSLQEGEAVSGLRISGSSQAEGGAAQPASFLQGRLDMGRVAVMGHSWGGATAALAASEHKQFGACICLDPWWEALPKDCSVLSKGQWNSSAPLLVVGSHAWNVPNARGTLSCGGPEQQAVLKAAAAGSRWQEGLSGGPGALLMVPRNSAHSSFDDVRLYFAKMAGPLLKMFKQPEGMSQQQAIAITTQAATHFLKTHLLQAEAKNGYSHAAAQHEGDGKATAACAGAPVRWTQEHVQWYRNQFGDPDQDSSNLAFLKLSSSDS